MQLFVWNKLYETGIKKIDEQHYRLLELINELGKSFAEQLPTPDITKIFSQLFDYTQYHFAEEEALMLPSDMPADEKLKHQRQHQAFINRLNTLSESSDLADEDVIAQLLDFLNSWLISHILITDRKLAGHLATDNNLNIPEIQKLLTEALSDSEENFHQIAENAPVMVRLLNLEQNQTIYNAAWIAFSGVQQLKTSEWEKCIQAEDVPAYESYMLQFSSPENQADIEYSMKNAEGQIRNLSERTFVHSNNQESGTTTNYLVSMTTDNSRFKEAEAIISQINSKIDLDVKQRIQHIKQLILTDPLTAVGNKRYILRRLTTEITKADRFNIPMSIMQVDIDHFGRVEDALGHITANILLKQFAQNISDNLRAADHIGRIGDKEFLIILPLTDTKKAELIAKKLMSAISELNLEDVPWPITASIAIAEKQHSDTSRSLLNRCEDALSDSKEKGRNQYSIAPADKPVK